MFIFILDAAFLFNWWTSTLASSVIYICTWNGIHLKDFWRCSFVLFLCSCSTRVERSKWIFVGNIEAKFYEYYRSASPLPQVSALFYGWDVQTWNRRMALFPIIIIHFTFNSCSRKVNVFQGEILILIFLGLGNFVMGEKIKLIIRITSFYI